MLIRMLALAAVGPLLLLAACSSSDDNATTTAKPSQTTSASGGAAQPQAVTITAVNYSLSPAKITASAGQVINISFKNNGTTEHSFTVGNTDVAEAAGGSSSSGSFTASQTVEFHCKYHPTQMMGTITINGSSSSNTSATSTPVSGVGGGMGY
jgi:plastocyanin